MSEFPSNERTVLFLFFQKTYYCKKFTIHSKR